MRVMFMRQFRSTDQQHQRWKRIKLPGGMPSDFSSVVRFALDRLYEKLVGPIDDNADLGTTPPLCKKCKEALALPDGGLCIFCLANERSGGKVKRGSELPSKPAHELGGVAQQAQNVDLLMPRSGDSHKRGFSSMSDCEVNQWAIDHGMSSDWTDEVLERLYKEFPERPVGSGTTEKNGKAPAGGKVKKGKAKAARVAPPAKAPKGRKAGKVGEK